VVGCLLEDGRAASHEPLHVGYFAVAQPGQGLDPAPLLLELPLGAPGREQHRVDRALECGLEALVLEGGPRGLDGELEVERVEPPGLDELLESGLRIAVALVEVRRAAKAR